MKKIPFDVTREDLQSPLNKKLQYQLTTLFQQYNIQQLPTNFSDYFGAGPALAPNFAQLSNELNPHRLKLNCYYCTIAALTNQTVLDLVAETEIMQQDQATLDEIMYLFREAGVPVAMINFYDYTLPAQQLWEHTYNYIDRALAEFEAAGLAYKRQPGVDQNGLFSPASGHMVVVAKDGNGVIAVLDYQSGSLEVLSRKHPPENAWHQSYSLFQQHTIQASQSWQEVYDFIVCQYIRKLSWRGVLVTEQHNQEKIYLYHISEENRIIAQIGNEVIKLDKYNAPKGMDTNPTIMICTVI
ncbi:hypothetical protein [Pantoea agglomerans]|uniref:hypothetical protein n=1 Tax=Enterobacter agglomerans TaxID=549 RepID=UPI0024131131|nr:hypothetical protein [Pantoea agglomerans]